MTDTPHEIARGLTKAQKRAVQNHPFWGATTYSTIKALRSRGILKEAALTPLGLAVRQALMEGEGE